MQNGKPHIKVIKGDITTLEVDAIVNAANSGLMGGGGVDGAIHAAGGPAIIEECQNIVEEQGRCNTGEAVITNGGNLPANKVIHAVGPVWNGGKNDEEDLLKNTYLNSLKIAEKHEIKTIAFPNISTGIYGFPKERAIKIVKDALVEHFHHQSTIEEVNFVCFDDENYNLYSSHFTPPEGH